MAGRGGIGPVTTVWASCATDLFIDLAANALQSDECGAVLLTLSPTALIDIDSLYDLIIKLHRTQKTRHGLFAWRWRYDQHAHTH